MIVPTVRKYSVQVIELLSPITGMLPFLSSGVYAYVSVGIQACRDAAFQANKERLEKEKTVNNKIAQA